VANQNAVRVFQDLTTLGLSPGAATGVIGNLVAESGVSPTSVQRGGPGRGIAQWSSGGRWDQLLAWARGRGSDPYSLSAQEAFMVQEMQAMGVWSQLQGTTDPLTAATIVMRKYEMPADQSAANAQHRAILGAQALAGSSGGSGNSLNISPFPTFGSPLIPWNWPSDVGNAITNKAADAVQSGAEKAADKVLSGIGPILMQGMFVALGVVLIGVGVTRGLSGYARGRAEEVAQALPPVAL